MPEKSLTIITVLSEGDHLSYNTSIQAGDDPALMAQSHMLVRDHNFSGRVRRFVVICGAEVQTVEGK